MIKRITLLILYVLGVGLFASGQTNDPVNTGKKVPPPPPPVERVPAVPKVNPPKIKVEPHAEQKPPPPPPPPIERPKKKVKKMPPTKIHQPERPAPPAPPEKGNIIFN